MKPHIKLKADVFGLGVSGAYRGASTTNPDLSEWYASGGSADGDLLPDLPELQHRARDIRRNNGFAHGLVENLVDNVVGTGIRFCSLPDWKTLSYHDPRFTEDWASEFGERFEAIFHEWFWSTACHAGDTLTGDMLTEQVYYSKLDNGGSLTLPLWLPKRGDGFATKLQTVEIDRLSNPRGAPNTTTLRGGIQHDEFGVPLGYHIKKTHPGDAFVLGLNATDYEWEFIPRRTKWGRLRVIHDFDSDRADQTRGVPLLAAVLGEFKNIDRYVKAEIQAAISNAMIWGAITTPLEHDEIVELFKGDEKAYMAARASHAVKMRPNTLATLFPGDKLESFMPQRPAAQFGVFVENIEKIISVGSGQPHMIAKKDFSKSNYSNTRAAMAELYRTVVRRRDRLGAGWLDRVCTLLMEEVVNDGRLDAPEFYQYQRCYTRGMWIGPARGYVDKEKEVKGDMLAISANMDTLMRVAASQGLSWRELLQQRKRERDYAAKLGIPEITESIGAARAPEAAANAADKKDDPDNPDPDDGTPPAEQEETAA